jgi:ABC-2 type transport system permease protein
MTTTAAAPSQIEPASATLPPVRGSSVASLWTLFTLTLRQHQHGKKWMVMAGLMLLPVGLVILVRCTARDVPAPVLEFIFAYMLIPQALLPLASLIYASGMIQDEQEEQTITYLLIRPISKWAIYLVKLLATVTVVVALSAVLTALTYAAIFIGSGSAHSDVLVRCMQTMLIHGLAVITYCCLFGLLALITKRILIVGILYIAIFEGLFANLAFGIRLITVIYYARLIAYHTLSFVVQTPNGTENLAADAWQLDLIKDPSLLLHPQLSTCILVLVISATVAAVFAAFLCSRREFHVKTPEKAG